MISDEKITHIVNLILQGLKAKGLASYPDENLTIRESKRIAIQFLSHLNACGDRARARIASMKNPPVEHSSQWDNLYNKYYEEELKKAGG